MGRVRSDFCRESRPGNYGYRQSELRFCNYRARSIQTLKWTEQPTVLISNPFHCTEKLLLMILSVHAISLATNALRQDFFQITYNRKLQPTFLWYVTDRMENDASNNYSIVTCIRCRGNVFTEPLPSNNRWIHIQTRSYWEGFMKYATEMGSRVMIYNMSQKSWWDFKILYVLNGPYIKHELI
jgi:hypothetical protein